MKGEEFNYILILKFLIFEIHYPGKLSYALIIDNALHGWQCLFVLGGRILPVKVFLHWYDSEWALRSYITDMIPVDVAGPLVPG